MSGGCCGCGGCGGAGADSLSGGAGGDTILGGAGADTIDGGDDADTVSGGDDADLIAGGAGDDVLSGDAGDDTVDGGEGSDSIDGGAGADSLSGGSGADSIEGGEGADTVDGGSGDDLIHAGADDDMVAAGSGADTVWGEGGDDSLSGDDGDDLIHGDSGEETVTIGGDFSGTITAANVASTGGGFTVTAQKLDASGQPMTPSAGDISFSDGGFGVKGGTAGPAGASTHELAQKDQAYGGPGGPDFVPRDARSGLPGQATHTNWHRPEHESTRGGVRVGARGGCLRGFRLGGGRDLREERDGGRDASARRRTRRRRHHAMGSEGAGRPGQGERRGRRGRLGAAENAGDVWAGGHSRPSSLSRPRARSQCRRYFADWIMELTEEFTLHASTGHIAMMYFDRALSTCTIEHWKWQRLAVVCLILAAKSEEREEDVPTLEQLQQRCAPSMAIVTRAKPTAVS